MNKEEMLDNIMTRRESEQYVGLSNVAFQYHIRSGNITPAKEFGKGKGKVQLFWKDDLNKLKEILE